MDELTTTNETADTVSFRSKPAEVPVSPDDPVEKINLVPDLLANEKTKAWLEQQVKDHQQLIKEDLESRSGYMAKRAEINKLYCGNVDPLKYPADGMPAAHDTIMTQTILLMVARGWDQVFPESGSIINVHGNGPEDEDAAQRKDEHMNWQLREKIPHYGLGHLENYNRFTIHGHSFRVGWYNPVTKCTQFDNCGADDFILPWGRKDIDPLLRNTPRYTRVRRYYRFQLEAMAREGYYHDVSRLWAEGSPQQPQADDDDSAVRQEATAVDGVDMPTTFTKKRGAPRVIYDVYTYLQLPNPETGEPEGDQRKVMLTFDKWSKAPLSLTVQEEDDPFDKARFDAETAAHKQLTDMLVQQFEQQSQMAMQAGGPPPPEPMPPEPPAPVIQRTLNTVIQYRYFDNPEGAYALGIGDLLMDPVKFLDALKNQYLVSSSFANLQGGIAAKGAFGKRGEFKAKHGLYIESELDASELPGGIRDFKFPGPPESMWKMIQATRGEVSELVANVDTMSGEPGPTNETASAAERRTATAAQLVSIGTRIYLIAMAEEPKMVAHHNSLFLKDEIYYVTEPSKQDPSKTARKPKNTAVDGPTREDYANPFDFSFTAGQRTQTKPERVSTALMLIDRLVQSPYAQEPTKGPVLFHAAFSKLFTAMEDPKMLAALGEPPPPPQQPQPPQPMAQEDENMGYFKDEDHPVLPDDPHENHVQVMIEFQQSPYFEKLSPTGRQMAERHYNEHVGYLYRQAAATGALSGVQNGPGGVRQPGPEGVPGMAAEQGQPGQGPAAPQGERGPPGMGKPGGNGAVPQ